MRRSLVDTVLYFILLTFPQRLFAQQNRPQKCGTEKVNVDLKSQDFNIPDGSEIGFLQPTTCTYQFLSQPDTRIVFNITQLFIGPGGNCDSNYVKLSDTLEGIKAVQPFCGDKPPSRAFVSQGNAAFAEFKVTQQLEKAFLKATIKAAPLFDQACGPSTLTLESSSAELKIPVSGKTFTSPAFCIYEIKANDSSKLQLQITSLTLGVDGQCSNDFIKVAESKETLGQTNYTYCGTKPPQNKFVSTTNGLAVGVSTFTDFQKTSIIATYSKVNFVSKLESSAKVVLLWLALVAVC